MLFLPANKFIPLPTPQHIRQSRLVLLLYWLVVFILYLPAAEAGRVGDYPGWVDFLNSVGFVDYLNRSASGIVGLYQFTQFVTYICYKLWHSNAWMWHLLFVSMQAVNAWLLYTLFRKLFQASAVRNATIVAAVGGGLYCVCPHISEVIVWEPAFHYLLGFMLQLIVLLQAQCYIETGNSRHVWTGRFVFALSTLSLEIHYLTPFLVLLMALYYHYSLRKGQPLRNTLLRFTLPQALLFAIYMVTMRAIYHETVAHVGPMALHLDAPLLSKGMKYVFHVLLLGRYYPVEARQAVYKFAETAAGLWLFYGVVVAAVALVAIRWKKLSGHARAVAFTFAYVLLTTALIMPMSFPDNNLVIYDRYLYELSGFAYMWLAVGLHLLIRNRTAFLGAAAVIGLINARFTHRAVAYWHQSAAVVNNLVKTFPNDSSKKVLLLNLPECLQGVQMVGSRDDGEFRMMYNAYTGQSLTNPVYDVEAFYTVDTGNGAHVQVLNDSTVQVTLNQWGTWWLYYGFGAGSYENADYKVNMRDVGHMYELTIKHPYNQYLVLYTKGKNWSVVDWKKKGVEQW